MVWHRACCGSQRRQLAVSKEYQLPRPKIIQDEEVFKLLDLMSIVNNYRLEDAFL